MLVHPTLSGAGQILLGLLAAVAAVFDIRYRRIPNWLVLAGIVAGLLWNTSVSGWSGLLLSLAGFGLGFVLYLPLYLIRARGAGDVKLLAAAGAITGPGNIFLICILTAILGGIIALIVLLIYGRLRKTLFNIGWMLQDLTHLRAPYKSTEELDVTTAKGMRLPHGAMIAVGVIAFIFLATHGVTI